MTFPDASLERTGVDPEVSAMIHGVPADAPERNHNGHSAPVAEPVYAPASERVPVTPLPGHRDVVNHTDTTTPERTAATRWDYRALDAGSNPERPSRLALGLSVSWLTVLGASVGLWLFLRWRRDRNRPINRLRRQAKQAAATVRDRVPSRDEILPKRLTSRVRSIR